jgi:hypothetical protein
VYQVSAKWFTSPIFEVLHAQKRDMGKCFCFTEEKYIATTITSWVGKEDL